MWQSRTDRRRLQVEGITLFDAMLLIAALAIGLGAARWWYELPGYVNQEGLDVQSVSEMVAWCLLPLSPALIGIRLRKPRPAWRRLVRQPGLQANLVVCLAAVSFLVTGQWGYRPDWRFLPLGIGVELPDGIGSTLAIAWLLTALVGRRRADPGVIDRLGRALGWAWIGLCLVVCIIRRESLVVRFLIQ